MECYVGNYYKNDRKDEFHNRGINDNSGDITDVLEHSKFYNEMKMGLFTGSSAAEVICSVHVKKPYANINYIKSVTGLYTERGIWRFTGECSSKALETTIETAIVNLMEEESFIYSILQAN